MNNDQAPSPNDQQMTNAQAPMTGGENTTAKARRREDSHEGSHELKFSSRLRAFAVALTPRRWCLGIGHLLVIGAWGLVIR
jgi:hypothetical protein